MRSQAHDRVVPEDSAIDVHVDYQFLPLFGIPSNNGSEIFGVRHRIQYIHLHHHIAVFGAVVNVCVAKGGPTNKAVVAFTEINIFATCDVPQIADAFC